MCDLSDGGHLCCVVAKHATLELYIIPVIADQLRYMSSLDELAYVRRDAILVASDMADLPLVYRFALHRDFLLTVLRLGVNDDVPENAEPLDSNSSLEASFSEISNKFRRFLIAHYGVTRGRMPVFAGVINRDIGLWESYLSAFMRGKDLGTMRPDTGAVVEMFTLPDWKGMTCFVNGGGVLLATQTLSPAPVPAPSSTLSGGADCGKRSCFIY